MLHQGPAHLCGTGHPGFSPATIRAAICSLNPAQLVLSGDPTPQQPASCSWVNLSQPPVSLPATETTHLPPSSPRTSIRPRVQSLRGCLSTTVQSWTGSQVTMNSEGEVYACLGSGGGLGAGSRKSNNGSKTWEVPGLMRKLRQWQPLLKGTEGPGDLKTLSAPPPQARNRHRQSGPLTLSTEPGAQATVTSSLGSLALPSACVCSFIHSASVS